MRFEAGTDSDGEGCGEGSKCRDVVSFGSSSAEERCVAAGGTAEDVETCERWTQGAISHLGPLARYAQGSTVAPAFPCGGFINEEGINFHLFRAGRACCTDGFSQCMGLAVHVVEAEMTLEMDFPANMSASQLETALRESIAASTGVSNTSVGKINITVKVVGTAPMVVADPAAFVASPEAKTAVEAGLAVKVGVPASDVTATLSLADGSSAAPAGAPAPASSPASAPSPAAAPGPAPSPSPAPASARRLEHEPERRLSGTVNVEYEIVADMASSSMMTTSLQADDGAASLTAAINDQLENVTDIEPVEVQDIEATPQVTITYEIRTTDAEAAQAAQEFIAEASSGGAAAEGLVSGITAELAEAGFTVTIAEISGSVEPVQIEPQGDAPPSTRTQSSSAFRLSHRDVATALSLVVALALA
jgi:hypothetical protein